MQGEITLRHFDKTDLPILREYVLLKASDVEIYSIIDKWNTCSYNGNYFEMFAVCLERTIIGTISLYQHTEGAISIGPEIFEEHREKGNASVAMSQVLVYARERGYKMATAQIRKNNIASIRLHEKNGFVFENIATNRNGNEVLIYTKML